MKILALVCLLTMSFSLIAQDLKRIIKSNTDFGEIYYVLKNDRNIKHGQYLSYFESMNVNDKSVEAFGNYYNNRKTGVWIYCDAEEATDPMVAIGEYSDDKKSGTWVYFYEPSSDEYSYVNLSGNYKHTSVTLPTKDYERFDIKLDTTGIRTASTGTYSDGKKTGIWSYYYKNGILACSYDHTAKSMVQNNGLTNYDQLGGLDRFKSLFHKAVYEKKIKSQPYYVQDSQALFELTTHADSVVVKRIEAGGSAPFANAMEKILGRIEHDWISYDPRLEENKILIRIKYVVMDNAGTLTLESIEPEK